MGWIRWWGLGTFIGLVLVIAGLWLLVVDGLVERMVEDLGTRLVGAKVELDEADLTLVPAGLTLVGLQVTNPDEPMRNAVEIGRMTVALDGAQLVRRKVIVEDLKAEGVRLGTPRKTSGAIDKSAGQEPPTEDAEAPGPAFTMPTLEIPNVQEVLAKEELETVKLVNELKADIERVRGTWEQRLEELPGKETFASYRTRVEKLKDVGKGGLGGVLGGVGEAQALRQDIQSDIERLKGAQGEFQKTLASIKARLERLKDAPRADVRRLQEKYSLSPQGLANLGETLLGQAMGERARQAVQWYERLEPLLERAKAARAKDAGPEVVKPLRASGVDVRFREREPLPDFLVRRAKLDWTLERGKLGGQIENITPDQDVLGKPLTFTFSGENLEGLRSVAVSGNLDHIDPANAHDRITVRAVGYEIDGLPVSKQEQWPVTLHQGRADLGLRASIQGTALSGTLDADLRALKISAGKADDSNRITRALTSAVSGISTLNVGADVTGSLDQYDIRVRSDLQRIVQQAAGKVVKDLSAEFQGKLTAAVSERVKGPLSEVRSQYGGLTQLGGDLAGRLTQGNEVLRSLASGGLGSKGAPERLPGGFKLPF